MSSKQVSLTLPEQTIDAETFFKNSILQLDLNNDKKDSNNTIINEMTNKEIHTVQTRNEEIDLFEERKQCWFLYLGFFSF